MKDDSKRTVKKASENLNGQLAIEYPVSEATMIDTMVEGTVILMEFQKPTLMPSH